jgi:hypothetical protein
LPENGSTGTPSFLSNGAVKTYETAYWEKLNELMEEAKKQGET